MRDVDEHVDQPLRCGTRPPERWRRSTSLAESRGSQRPVCHGSAANWRRRVARAAIGQRRPRAARTAGSARTAGHLYPDSAGRPACSAAGPNGARKAARHGPRRGGSRPRPAPAASGGSWPLLMKGRPALDGGQRVVGRGVELGLDRPGGVSRRDLPRGPVDPRDDADGERVLYRCGRPARPGQPFADPGAADCLVPAVIPAWADIAARSTIDAFAWRGGVHRDGGDGVGRVQHPADAFQHERGIPDCETVRGDAIAKPVSLGCSSTGTSPASCNAWAAGTTCFPTSTTPMPSKAESDGRVLTGVAGTDGRRRRHTRGDPGVEQAGQRLGQPQAGARAASRVACPREPSGHARAPDDKWRAADRPSRRRAWPRASG